MSNRIPSQSNPDPNESSDPSLGAPPDAPDAAEPRDAGAIYTQPNFTDEPADDGDGAFAPRDRRQLVLVKHGHRYVFRYERGEESKVLSGLVDMARDPHSDLDWFDAAVLSHQLGQRISEQLEKLRTA